MSLFQIQTGKNQKSGIGESTGMERKTKSRGWGTYGDGEKLKVGDGEFPVPVTALVETLGLLIANRTSSKLRQVDDGIV